MGFAESILFEKIKLSGLSGFSKCALLEENLQNLLSNETPNAQTQLMNKEGR